MNFNSKIVLVKKKRSQSVMMTSNNLTPKQGVTQRLCENEKTKLSLNSMREEAVKCVQRFHHPSALEDFPKIESER